MSPKIGKAEGTALAKPTRISFLVVVLAPNRGAFGHFKACAELYMNGFIIAVISFTLPTNSRGVSDVTIDR